jgi:hypothetical protein
MHFRGNPATGDRSSTTPNASRLRRRWPGLNPRVGAQWLRVIVLGLICALHHPSPASAISIDTWLEGEGLVLSSTLNQTQKQHFPSTSALGGGRTLSATKTNSAAGFTLLSIGSGELAYSQGTNLGLGVVTWDGDADPVTLNPVGLGGINLTQDGGTAFTLDLLGFDYPGGVSSNIVLGVYDSSSPSGGRVSTVTITLDRAWLGPGAFTLTVPFALVMTAGSGTIPAPGGGIFVTKTEFGPDGGADLTRLGALTLTLDGRQTSAVDIFMGRIATNGRCPLVPNSSGAVVDGCGVCLDDPDATGAKDRCGVCLNGPDGYDYAANTTLDGCSQCPGEVGYTFPSGSKDQCGVCLNGPAPYAYIDSRDACDLCPSSPSFGTTLDACGVCGGTAKTASECLPPPSCIIVSPTAKIRTFERRLLEKAGALRNRFLSDRGRWTRNKCTGPFSPIEQRIKRAFDTISAQGRSIFTRGIEVCGEECVTVSYASEVAALGPSFTTLERETLRAAKMVQRCYERRGVVRRSSPGGRVVTTIKDVRRGLTQLIKDCRSSTVCR